MHIFRHKSKNFMMSLPNGKVLEFINGEFATENEVVAKVIRSRIGKVIGLREVKGDELAKKVEKLTNTPEQIEEKKIIEEAPKYICDFCGKDYQTASALKGHITKKHYAEKLALEKKSKE